MDEDENTMPSDWAPCAGVSDGGRVDGGAGPEDGSRSGTGDGGSAGINLSDMLRAAIAGIKVPTPGAGARAVARTDEWASLSAEERAQRDRRDAGPSGIAKRPRSPPSGDLSPNSDRSKRRRIRK